MKFVGKREAAASFGFDKSDAYQGRKDKYLSDRCPYSRNSWSKRRTSSRGLELLTSKVNETRVRERSGPLLACVVSTDSWPGLVGVSCNGAVSTSITSEVFPFFFGALNAGCIAGFSR